MSYFLGLNYCGFVEMLLFIKYLYDWKRIIEPHDNYDLQAGVESAVNSRSTEGNRYL